MFVEMTKQLTWTIFLILLLDLKWKLQTIWEAIDAG